MTKVLILMTCEASSIPHFKTPRQIFVEMHFTQHFIPLDKVNVFTVFFFNFNKVHILINCTRFLLDTKCDSMNSLAMETKKCEVVTLSPSFLQTTL